MRNSSLRFWLVVLALSTTPQLASATLTLPLSPAANGSDGVLNVSAANLTIDLSQAVTGTWDQAGAGDGKGVYDPAQWAVVFKYSSVNIASGRTVTFLNHPSGAPVVWLVKDTVRVVGTLDLNGANGVSTNSYSTPGPGGFAGGRGSWPGSTGNAGLGPGGGGFPYGCGSHATIGQNTHYTDEINGETYGSAQIFPLIGGSGGGGGLPNAYGPGQGGAGGGAILIVAASRATIVGVIRAAGGNNHDGYYVYSGSGSGGAVRIVADTLAGTGSINAAGGNSSSRGGDGRVRLEANTFTLTQQSSPAYTLKTPLVVGDPQIWPPAPTPTVRIATVNGAAAPSDPVGGLLVGDLVISATASIPITISAQNVPTNSTLTVRVVLGSGTEYSVPASFSSGDVTASTWSATLTSLSPARVSVLQAKVVLP